MKSREGIAEKHAKGPSPGPGTQWQLTTKAGVRMTVIGKTAFLACASVGLNLGHVAHIRPV